MSDVFGDPAAASSGFADLLDDPRARAALLQFGISLMQPQYGQTPLGALGGAIGAGGEAVGRIEEQDRKTAETSSKLAQREANIGNQQGKLDAMADRIAAQRVQHEATAGISTERLNQGQKRLEQGERRLGLQELFANKKPQTEQEKTFDRRIKEDAEYIMQALQKEKDAQADILTGKDYKPDPRLAPYRGKVTRTEIEDVMRNDPVYRESAFGRFGHTLQAPSVPGTQGQTQLIQGDKTAPGQFPLIPEKDEDAVRGRTYMNKNGVPLRYMGNGEWSRSI